MKWNTKLALIGAALVFGAALPPAARAGGIILYEIATPDVGLAGAGYAARAQDASTVFKNPAGMSQLDGTQFQSGLQALYGSVSFTPNANTSPRLGSGDGGNAVGWLPGGSLFLTHKLDDHWAVGFGALSYFGLATDYDNNWVGRYYAQKSMLVGMSLMPSVSYQANEWLSLGAGLNAMYGYLNNEVAVNQIGPDGQMKLEEGTWGFGANVGVLVEPVKGTRFGVTYLSPVQLDFADTPSFSNLGPGLSALLANPSQINLGTKVPQSVMLSAYHELNATWAILGNFGWQDWSQFGEVSVGVEPAGLSRTVNANYQDTWHGALGAQYRASDRWQFTGGAAFDSSAVDSENRTVVLPMGQSWRFGVGALYHASAKLDLGLAYEFMWIGDMSVDQGRDLSLRGRVAGSYNDAWFSFITANLTWRF